MGNCDMCGREEELRNVNVEGTLLDVCGNCSKFGSVIEEVEVIKHVNFKKVKEEFVEDFIEGFEKIVRKEREKKGMTQKEVAGKLNVKESVIHKIENGFGPDLVLAKKLENFFGVELVKSYDSKLNFKDKTLKISDLL